MPVQSAIEAAESAVRELTDTMTRVSAEQCGLDPRAGRFYISDDAIIVDTSARSLEYYGGFEYVDDYSKTVIGQFTIYTSDDDRVQEAIDAYNESLEEATEE